MRTRLPVDRMCDTLHDDNRRAYTNRHIHRTKCILWFGRNYAKWKTDRQFILIRRRTWICFRVFFVFSFSAAGRMQNRIEIGKQKTKKIIARSAQEHLPLNVQKKLLRPNSLHCKTKWNNADAESNTLFTHNSFFDVLFYKALKMVFFFCSSTSFGFRWFLCGRCCCCCLLVLLASRHTVHNMYFYWNLFFFF